MGITNKIKKQLLCEKKASQKRSTYPSPFTLIAIINLCYFLIFVQEPELIARTLFNCSEDISFNIVLNFISSRTKYFSADSNSLTNKNKKVFCETYIFFPVSLGLNVTLTFLLLFYFGLVNKKLYV